MIARASPAHAGMYAKGEEHCNTPTVFPVGRCKHERFSRPQEKTLRNRHRSQASDAPLRPSIGAHWSYVCARPWFGFTAI